MYGLRFNYKSGIFGKNMKKKKHVTPNFAWTRLNILFMGLISCQQLCEYHALSYSSSNLLIYDSGVSGTKKLIYSIVFYS